MLLRFSLELGRERGQSFKRQDIWHERYNDLILKKYVLSMIEKETRNIVVFLFWLELKNVWWDSEIYFFTVTLYARC